MQHHSNKSTIWANNVLYNNAYKAESTDFIYCQVSLADSSPGQWWSWLALRIELSDCFLGTSFRLNGFGMTQSGLSHYQRFRVWVLGQVASTWFLLTVLSAPVSSVRKGPPTPVPSSHPAMWDSFDDPLPNSTLVAAKWFSNHVILAVVTGWGIFP